MPRVLTKREIVALFYKTMMTLLEGLNREIPDNQAIQGRLQLLGTIERLGHIAQEPLCYAWHRELTDEVRELLKNHDVQLFVLLNDNVALAGFGLVEAWPTFSPSSKNKLWKLLHNLTKYADALCRTEDTVNEEAGEADNAQIEKLMDMASNIKGLEVNRETLHIGVHLPTLLMENEAMLSMVLGMARDYMGGDGGSDKSAAAVQALQGVWGQLGGGGPPPSLDL
jgi:hypothetical protein